MNTDKLMSLAKPASDNETSEEKQARTIAFFDEAIDLFNEHIAGDVTTVTGVVLTTPPIEKK
jgi:hypothetical protein